MKTTRHSLMAKGILVLLSLLILVFIFTYSWYTPPDTPVYATGVQVSTKSDAEFEYAIGFFNSQTGGNYKVTAFSNSSETLDLEHLNVPGDLDGNNELIDYNLLVDYKPIDVTGDGATLIRPSMQYGNSSIDTDSNNYSVANPNVQYITFDLILRTKQRSAEVKLSSGSYAIGACESEPGDGSLVGANAANKSSYGNFSKDAVVGAIRVAFIGYDSNLTAANLKSNTDAYLNNTATLLWLPRPEIELVPDDNSTENWTLYTNRTSGSTFTHTYYQIFEDPTIQANHTVANYTDTVTDLTTSQSIGQISISDSGHVIDNETYIYSKIKVRIWVEGTDPEARRAISGGRFILNFELSTK